VSEDEGLATTCMALDMSWAAIPQHNVTLKDENRVIDEGVKTESTISITESKLMENKACRWRTRWPPEKKSIYTRGLKPSGPLRHVQHRFEGNEYEESTPSKCSTSGLYKVYHHDKG